MVQLEKNEQGVFVLPAGVNCKLFELYDIYRKELKKLIFVVEVCTKKFPGQVLNEIRSLNDHIASCFLVSNTEEDCLNELSKAKRHLKRAISDCYKILLQIYYPDTISSFYEQYKSVNLCLVNDGRFLPELTRLEGVAKEKTLSAKLDEFSLLPDDENSHIPFKEAVLAYEDVILHIENHSQGLANVSQLARDNSKKENRRGWKFAFIGVLLGAAVTFIIQNWNAIKLLFSTPR
jgi:hypothetical protein